MKKNLVVTIDWAGSLYDPEAGEFMDKIEAALDSAPPGGTVILQANVACHDYHRGWFDGVSSKYYWEDLASHFQRVHLALIAICLSKSRWFFISSNDCLGSWWDLALSCHGRIWANPYAKVGFPEIYIDLIPPLASGGLRRFSAYQTIEDARKNAILHAKDAYSLGLISLVLQGPGWLEKDGIEALYSWINKSGVSGKLRSTTRRELLDVTPDVLGAIEQRADLSSRRRQITVSRLENGLVALKDRNIVGRAQVMSSIRAGGAARVLFEDYRSWLSRRISRYEFGSHDRWWLSGGGMLVIDLSTGVPPQAMIQALLSRRIHLVMLCSSDELLKERMETILSRSQRVGLSRKDILTAWRGRLDWMTGDIKSVTCVWMACAGNDLVEFGIGGARVMTQYRLSGNFGRAGLGWVEAISSKPSDGGDEASESLTAVNEISGMLTNGILRQYHWSHKISLSVTLRFCLLNEMMQLALSGQWPDLYEQCKLLATAGWGFGADEAQWNALIRGFSQDVALSEAVKEIGGKMEVIPKNATITELRQRLPKTSGVARLEVSGARLSRHYEAFAVKIARNLVATRAVESVAMADLFVTLAWGYPGKSPVPSELAVEVGDGRVSQWLDRDL
jgi:enoyl-CoA hydratase/carnithine racemase